MKNKTLLIWVILTLVVLALSLFNFSRVIEICWDGLEVDESLLKELCGISKDEYLSGNYDPEDCPNPGDALRMVGGCETDWPSVLEMTFFTMLFYLFVSGVFFLIRRLIRRKKAV